MKPELPPGKPFAFPPGEGPGTYVYAQRARMIEWRRALQAQRNADALAAQAERDAERTRPK